MRKIRSIVAVVLVSISAVLLSLVTAHADSIISSQGELWLWPLTKTTPTGYTYLNVTSGYGMRDGKPHTGTDIGTGGECPPVCAMKSGIVQYTKPISGYGRCLKIAHYDSDGRITNYSFYAHLGSYVKSAGDVVARGEVIAYVGGSNYVNGQIVDDEDNGAYGKHLHFEIMDSSNNVINNTPLSIDGDENTKKKLYDTNLTIRYVTYKMATVTTLEALDEAVNDSELKYITIPSGASITIPNGSYSDSIPAGVTLCVSNGAELVICDNSFNIWGSLKLETNSTLELAMSSDERVSVIDGGSVVAETGCVITGDGRLEQWDNSTITGIPVGEIAHYANVTTEAELRNAMQHSDYYENRVWIDAALSITSDLTVPLNTELGCWYPLTITDGATVINNGELRPGEVLTINAGGALINNGEINFYGCRLVNNGVFTNNGSSVACEVTSFESLASIATPGSTAVINADITLRKDITIGYFEINEGCTLTIPSGVTLTIDDGDDVSSVASSIYGKLLVEAGGQLVNNEFRISVKGDSGVLDCSNGTYIYNYQFHDNGSIESYSEKVVKGIHVSEISLSDYSVSTEAELRRVLALDGYNSIGVSISESIVLTDDLTIPENAAVALSNYSKYIKLSVPSNISLLNMGSIGIWNSNDIFVQSGGILDNPGQISISEGTLKIESGGVLKNTGEIYEHSPDGRLINDGTLSGTVTVVDDGEVKTYAELVSAIAAGVAVIRVQRDFTLENDVVVNAPTSIRFGNSTVTIPRNVSLILNGANAYIDSGTVVVCNGGRLVQNKVEHVTANIDIFGGALSLLPGSELVLNDGGIGVQHSGTVSAEDCVKTGNGIIVFHIRSSEKLSETAMAPLDNCRYYLHSDFTIQDSVAAHNRSVIYSHIIVPNGVTLELYELTSILGTLEVQPGGRLISHSYISVGDGGRLIIADGCYTADEEGNVYVSEGGYVQGVSAEIDTPEPLLPEAATTDFSTESLTGLSADMEYCISEDPTYSSGSFTPVPEGTSSLDLSSLIPNAGAQPKYLHLRMKAANGGAAGDITSVTIPPRQATPEIAIDYINERTEQKLPDTVLYGTGTDAATAGENAYLPLTPGVTMGFRVAATDSSFQSNLQQLTLPARPAAPQGVVKTDESARGAGDGTLTNLNSTMEYRLGTSADWTSIGENETQLTGLSAGTYQVRTKAVAGSNFSSEITELTITPGNAFIVTFASNGGTDVANTENVTANTGITAPQPPTKVGYTFDGWYENTELTDAWDFAADTVTNDTTLYAKWLPATDTAYTVKHYQQDLSRNGYTLMSEESDRGTTGSQLTLSALAKTVDGFTYAIGKIDDTAVETASILADGSLAIGLYYTRNATYTVTFETNGHGTAPSVLTGLSFGAAIQAPSPAPTADGMRFYGWFRESNCLTAWDFDADTISGSITLYAGWTPAAPTVTPTPTPTPTPTAKPTPTPTAVPDPVPPPTPTTVPTLPPPMPPIATATPTASPVIPPASTPTAPPTSTPVPTPTASSTVQPAGGANTPIPTSTATLPPLPPPPTPVNTPIPTPPSGTIWTPTPTATLSPTASPTPTPAITPPTQPAPEVPHALTVVAGTGIKSVTGAGAYKPGITVTVNAEVADGYTWQGWQSSSPTVAAGIQKAYSFVMPASAVTMTAVAALNQYKVSFRTGQHCAMTGTNAADSFNAYTDRLVAENGYPLPKTLKATMGGVDFTDFTYNSNTGEISIEAGKIKGDILFVSLYSITYDADVQHGTISGEFPKACYTSYSGMITPETGRLLPQKLTAKLNGEQFTDFTYNNTTGAVLIEADKTVGDIVFTGVCPLNKCSITYPGGQYGTITGTDSANYETSYTDVLVPEKGYALPVALTATISATGSDPQSFTQFAYNNTTGAIDIAAGVILGNITFEGACTLAQFAISYVPGQHATLTGTTTADMFTEYRDTLVPESGFGLPVKLYAEMDGNDFTSFIYDGSDGSLWIKEGRIKGDIVFAGAYSISYDPAQNGAITGASAEHYFSSYQDVLVPAPGFQLPTTLRATMEGVAFTDFTYDKESGAIAIATGTILGNIVFQGDCTPTAYSVSYAAEQHGSITGTDKAVVSSDYTDTLIPEDGYLRPNTLTATMDGSAFTAFTYDNITGAIRIAAGQILGDIVFSGLCTPTDVLPPTITTQPENVSADYGYTEKSTSIVAADQEYCELSYQWYVNGENANTGGTLIANAIAATLSLPDGRPVGKHYFYCVVTATHQSSLHVNSTASNTMTLTVLQIKPVFDKHPVDITVVDSESAEFTANATGGPAPSLQWEVSMDDGATWNNATGTGATTNTYTTANVTPENDGYRYRCAATALEYTVYSDVAVLTVERNRVVGLRSNAVIERGEEITFTAVGAGMENTAPADGDVRFEPVDWKINPSGAFERGGPYTASFSTEKMKLGSHTLTVRYQRQVYDATIGDWIAEPGELASVRVPEKIVSTEVPLTGDDAPVALLFHLILASAFLLILRMRKRKCIGQ